MTMRWEKLSPAEFQQLQDLTAYSSRKLKDVLEEFTGGGGGVGGGGGTVGQDAKYHPDGEIDYEGFRQFMNTYLEVQTSEELCRHLFLSFVKRPKTQQVFSKSIKEMAVVSSTTACAPITSHNAAGGSISNLVICSVGPLEGVGAGIGPGTPQIGGGTLAGKFQGLTEKISSLGRSESDSIARNRTGSLGASVHPMVTVTHANSYTADSKVEKSSDSSPSNSQVSRSSSKKSNTSLLVTNDVRSLVRKSSALEVHTVRVPLKDIVCYLSLLEGGTPEHQLEFMFRLYDTDSNGVLDTNEMDSIVTQMIQVAEYLGWDVTELRPILRDMLTEIDYDNDGTVSLAEWIKGGLTTVPLLVLLGVDTNMKEDGHHLWRLKHFNRPAYCNLCLNMLMGLGKKGLACVFCKYTVHERCVQRAPASCVATYVKSTRTPQIMLHHWVEGNCAGRCNRCKKNIKSYNGITGLQCRWCHMKLHNRCTSHVKPDCNLGELRTHILPPTSICPAVLDRQRSKKGIPRSESSSTCLTDVGMISPAVSFQIFPPSTSSILIVFVNPKSGGRQGEKLLRKFQYILNPRQVFNLAKEGPMPGLYMFKDVPSVRVLVCGGDGTVGWVLEAMDKIQWVTLPCVAIIPLGTGNDLARCLRWGGGYEGETLFKILKKIDKATCVMMDRWHIEVSETREEDETGDDIPYNIVNNYFSIGVDAAICNKFHHEREKNPEKFNSRMKNKLWYFEYATTETFAASCKNLHEDIDIMCDGVSLDLSNGPSLQGVALLNIPYTHGGSNMWGENLTKKSKGNRSKKKKKKKKDRERELSTSSFNSVDLSTAIQDIGDKLIEVIGFENCLHMGQVKTGLRASGRRLAQCCSVVIRTRKKFPMQIDGEPWYQPPCTIRVTHRNQVPMLMAPKASSRKGFFSIFKK